MVEDGQGQPGTAEDGQGWLRMAKDNQGWPRMVGDGHEQPRMTKDGQGWLRMAKDCQGLTRIVNKMMNLKFELQLPSDDNLNFNRFFSFPRGHINLPIEQSNVQGMIALGQRSLSTLLAARESAELLDGSPYFFKFSCCFFVRRMSP